jgi:hypothetical protein
MNAGAMLMWFIVAIFEPDKIISKLDMILGLGFYWIAYMGMRDHLNRHGN